MTKELTDFIDAHESDYTELEVCKKRSKKLEKANKGLDKLTDTLQDTIDNQVLELDAVNDLNSNLRKHRSSDRMGLLLDLIDDLGLIDRKGELKSLGDVIPVITSYMRTSI